MLKFAGKSVAVAASAAFTIFPPLGAEAAAIGPHAAMCDNGGSAVLVQVDGLKSRSGKIRVQLYTSNSHTFLEKGEWLERVEVPVPSSGGANVCVPVPKPGNYAVYVRHDVNGNGKSDRKDGGGFSGNPDVSLSDLITKKKPSMSKTQFSVGNETRPIRVVMNYVQGLSFQPLKQFR